MNQMHMDPTKDTLCFLTGMGIGAGLMYIMDPQMGRRRRALARDQMVSMMHDAQEGMQTLGTDLSNRAHGVMAETRNLFSSEQPSDHQLRERVRSQMGRIVSHPGAIDVDVYNGYVTLSGPIFLEEACSLLNMVRSMSGVQGVNDRLARHQEAGNVSALQGGRRQRGTGGMDLFQQNWSPTTRAMAGLTGAGLLAYGFTQSAPWSCFLGTLGLGLLTSGMTNQGIRDAIPESMMPQNMFSWESMGQMQRSAGDMASRAMESAGMR